MSILGSDDHSTTPTKRTRVPRRKVAKSSAPKWSDTVNERLAKLEVPARSTGAIPSTVRKRFEETDRTVERVSRERVAVRLGTIPVGQATATRISTSPFDVSYDTGGETITLPDTFGSYTSYVIPAKGGYTFELSGTKVLAYVSGGTEVTAATDLEALNPITVLAYNNARSDRVAYEAGGPEKLVKAEIEVAADVGVDTTNYWTLTLRHRRASQATGELVGAAIATSEHGLTALDRATLYEVPTGLTMTDGERLVLYVSETANPEVLEDLVLWLTIQREVN